MPSPAEPHQSGLPGKIPLTARALDQLDAQVADAEDRSLNLSSSSEHTDIGDLHTTSSNTREANETSPNFESENSKDPSAPIPLMKDYSLNGIIYRSPDTLHNLITIEPAPAKGLAVFALRDLPPHTLLLSERPLLSLTDDGATATDPVDTLVDGLPPPLQRAYHALHASPSPNESLNRRVLYGNGFAIARTNTTAVFEVASRINHSCVPNARFRWDEDAGRMDYYTVREVFEGEEVCIDYGHTKGRLWKYYGFECACGGCTEWGSVTSSGGVSEGDSGDGADRRLVQTDGLWRPVEVAALEREKTTTTEMDEMDKENLRPESAGV